MASLHSFKNSDPTALRRTRIAIVRIKDLNACSCPSAATFTSQFICNEPVLTTTRANCMTGNRNMILDIGANLLNRLCLIQACQRNGIAAREVIRTSPVVAIGLIIVVRKIRNGVKYSSDRDTLRVECKSAVFHADFLLLRLSRFGNSTGSDASS